MSVKVEGYVPSYGFNKQGPLRVYVLPDRASAHRFRQQMEEILPSFLSRVVEG